jgi:hypothetical protein
MRFANALTMRTRCYITPLFGAYIADAHWGRFKTICWAVVIALIGHIILIVSAVPGVIEKKSAVAPFVIALIVMGFGSSSFYSMLDQAKESRNGNVQVKHLSSGRGTIQAHQTFCRDHCQRGAGHRRSVYDSPESLHGRFISTIMVQIYPDALLRFLVLLSPYQRRSSDWSDWNDILGEGKAFFFFLTAVDRETHLFHQVCRILSCIHPSNCRILTLPAHPLIRTQTVRTHPAHWLGSCHRHPAVATRCSG